MSLLPRLEESKADDQVGYYRRIDNLDSTMSLPTSRPNDKTQHPIPIC